MNNITKKVAMISLLFLLVSCRGGEDTENKEVNTDVSGANVIVDENQTESEGMETDGMETESMESEEENIDRSDIVVDESGTVDTNVGGANVDFK